MKKINSIGYGGKVIGIGLLNVLVMPGILAGVNRWFDCHYISFVANVLLVVGSSILICFFLLLIIELRQDKKIDQYYSQHQNVKIELPDGTWECGVCGSRMIGKDSTSCNTCGCNLYMS